MAFKFRSNKPSLTSTTNSSSTTKASTGIKQLSGEGGHSIVEGVAGDDIVIPKLTSTQLSKLAKVYPAWLRDGSSVKRLPGVYQGVLGQVQLQSNLIGIDISNGLPFSNNIGQKVQSSFNVIKQQQQQQPQEYMNRFTDTERVHQLLSASLLSNETLATIWAHVNKTFPGKLTNREVCLALALIAIFQRLEKVDGSFGVIKTELEKDPFNLVKAEKKPPVPILYPNHNHRTAISQNKYDNNNRNSNNNTHQSLTNTNFVLSSSTKTINDEILVDLWGTNDDEESLKKQNGTVNESLRLSSSKSEQCLTKRPLSCNTSLIDSDCVRFEIEFFTLEQTWLRFLKAIKNIFKRTFDILNVENSRLSAIEALKTQQGENFSKQLCLCYPLAHNIKYKIDDLNTIRIYGRRLSRCKNNTEDHKAITDIRKDEKNDSLSGLFDKNYIEQIDDLMTSINEYWAVLINLFHESGHTTFIEYIMDGLNYNQQTVFSQTIDELINELDGSGKKNVCSICHTNFYLKPLSKNSSRERLTIEDAELIADDDIKLLSLDNVHYYHAKCANFWINQVDSTVLPFHNYSTDTTGILSPAKQ